MSYKTEPSLRAIKAQRRCFPGDRKFGDMESIVRDYVENVRHRAMMELAAFRGMSNLRRAVEQAALALRADGKRLDHQRRIPEPALRAWAERLLRKTSSMGACQSFEALFAIVERESLHLWGVGELTVYDTALRIGAHLGLEPSEVFLHAGTREGAKALGIDGNRRTISPQELPKAFRQLKPREIEDCLCIYKDDLKTMKPITLP